MTDFGATHAAEKLFRPIRASAIQAVASSWLIRFISKRACNSFQLAGSSALTVVPLATRARTNERACPSVRNTAGRLLPLRSRMTTTALRLPDWNRTAAIDRCGALRRPADDLMRIPTIADTCSD